MSFNIAIDGPAGAGKSTIARMLAKDLGYVYVDTGAMYRAMGCYFTDLGIAEGEQEKMAQCCKDAEIEIAYEDGVQQVFLNGENVSVRIRTEQAGLMASACAKVMPVREKLVQLQQQLAAKTDVVMDGRDIGTQVLPNADVKIYLTASSHTRALRRYKELIEKGVECVLEDVEADIIARDKQDMEREISPLRQAEDAYLLDSSELDIQGVLDEMKSVIEGVKKNGKHEVVLAKSAGFCFGVQRAVDTVYEQAAGGISPIYTFGPIIHNEEVVNDLKSRGVSVIDTEEELNKLAEGTVIIRSHGVAEQVYELIQSRGLHLVDATCPFVKKIHRIVAEESESGKHIIIIGNDRHPEVEGIKGWVHGEVTVIESAEEAKAFAEPLDKSICIVSQTTFNHNKFQDLVEIISEKRYNVNCVNTICNATGERQREAEQIAATVDGMIVIGGKHSSNTQKLYEICKRHCPQTYFIQTAADLSTKDLDMRRIGITAGASTPKNIIEEVQKNVRNEF